LSNLNKTVTVGIPTYNRPDNLKNIIECVQKQTYKDIEIFISDNASENQENIQSIVNQFKKHDPRITLFLQKKNLGAIRNMLFLLDHAKTDYFIWMADDDEFDPAFIETLFKHLSVNTGASVAITGVKTIDLSNKITVQYETGSYLQKISSPDRYQRLLNYINMPSEHGKSRIFWGLCRTEILKKAVKEVISQGDIDLNKEILSMQFPLDMQMLVHGDLEVIPETLFQAYLLASSNGMREGKMFSGREIQICKMGFDAYRAVIINTPYLNDEQKLKLKKLLDKGEKKDLIKIISYSLLSRYTPRIARFFKKIYFKLFV
jgi:glycosyltransferase involved in cell wall biosynthesis